MSGDPYAQLAEFYDLENAHLTDDLPFWLALAAEHGGPVLELGCGTGRVTQQLARAGFAVTGVDASPAMLTRARQRLAALPRTAAPVTLLEGDFLTIPLPDPHFALALLPYNTFMHLLTTDAQLAALRRIHAALHPGGGLAFDIANPIEVFASASPHPTLERVFTDAEGQTVQQFAHQFLQRVEQRNTILWQYDVISPIGAVRRVLVETVFRLTFPAELRLLLTTAGFTVNHLLGDFDFDTPLEESSPRMVVVAQAH